MDSNRWIFFFLFCVFSFWGMAQSDSVSGSQILIEHYTLEELMHTPIFTAQKKAQAMDEISASVTILTENDIENYGFTSLVDIVNHITGFYMIDDYFWMGNVNFGVRGFYNVGIASNLVILVNGVSQMSDEYADFPDTKITVPVEAIKRIEVIKGPVSVMYGSGGFFGAINIITHEKNKEDYIDVCAKVGSNNSGEINFGINQSIDNISFSIYASAHENKGLDVLYGDLTSDEVLLSEHNQSLTSSTYNQLGISKKYFGASVSVSDLSFNLDFSETVKGIMDGVPSFGKGSQITHNSANFSVRQDQNMRKGFSFYWQAGYYQHIHNVDYEEFFEHYYRNDFKKTRAFDLEGGLFYLPFSSLEFNLGLYYRNLFDLFQMTSSNYYTLDRGDGEVGIPRGENMQTSAIYMQAEWKVVEYLMLTGGIRLEHLSDYNLFFARGVVTIDNTVQRSDHAPGVNRTVIEQTYKAPNSGLSIIPKVGLIISPHRKLTFKLLYGKSIKQPNFIDNIRQLLMDGSKFLNPQTIKTYELNALVKPSKTVLLQGNLFYNNLDNLISASNIFNRETKQWEIQSANSGRMQTIGVESALKLDFQPNWQFELSGLYQETKVQSEGYDKEMPGYSPHWLLYGKAVYHLNKNWSVGTKIKYTGAMDAKWDFVTTPDDGYRVGAASAAYYTMDINTIYRNIFSKGIYAKLNIENITDQFYRYPTTESNVWIDKGTIGAGRRGVFTLGVKF